MIELFFGEYTHPEWLKNLTFGRYPDDTSTATITFLVTQGGSVSLTCHTLDEIENDGRYTRDELGTCIFDVTRNGFAPNKDHPGMEMVSFEWIILDLNHGAPYKIHWKAIASKKRSGGQVEISDPIEFDSAIYSAHKNLYPNMVELGDGWVGYKLPFEGNFYVHPLFKGGIFHWHNIVMLEPYKNRLYNNHSGANKENALFYLKDDAYKDHEKQFLAKALRYIVDHKVKLVSEGLLDPNY